MTDIGYDLGSAHGRVIISTNVGEAMDTAQRQFDAGIAGMSASIQSWGAQLTQLGAQMSILTEPLRGVISTGLSVVADFDDIMTSIEARTGASAEEMERIRAFAREQGAASVFSAQQVGEALLNLMTSGLSLEEAMATLPSVLNAATADAADLGTTAGIVTNIMASFGLEAENAQEIVDALARASGASKSSISTLGQGFSNVGGLAKQFGLDVSETAAILAIFSNNGIEGAEAGTQLKSMLTSMSSDTKATQDAWKELGVSLYDANGNMRDLNTVFLELDAALDKLPMEEQNRLTMDLAGSFGQLGFTALRSGMSIEEMEKAMEGQADATSIASKMMGTLRNMVNSLMGSWETFLEIALAPTVEEYLKPIINTMIELVNAMATWAQANPEITQTIAILAITLAGIGPILIGVGLAVTVAGAAFGLLLSPIVLVAGGLFALAVVFRDQIPAMVDSIKTFIAGFQAAFNQASSIARGMATLFTALRASGVGIFDAIRAEINAFVFASLRLLGVSSETATQIRDGLLAAVTGFEALFDGAMRVFDMAQQALIFFALDVSNAISNLDFSSITDFYDEVGARFSVFSGYVDETIDNFNRLRDAGFDIFDTLRTMITFNLRGFLELIGITGDTATAVQGWMSTAVTNVERLFNAVGDVISSVWDWLQSLNINTSGIGEIIGPLYEVGSWLLAMTSPFSLAFKILTELGVDFIGIIEDVASGISTFFDVLADGGTLTDGLRAVFGDEFVNGVTGAVDTVTGVINDFINLLAGLWDFVSPALQNLGNWFLNDVLPAVASLIENAVMPALTSIGNFLGDLWAIVSPSLESFAEWFLYTALPEIQSFISDTIIPGIETFIQTLTRIWNDVSPYLLEFANWFLNDALPRIIDFINTTVMPIVNDFINLVAGIWDVVSGALDLLYTWFITDGLPFIMTKLGEAQETFQKVIEVIAGIWNSVKQGVEDFKNGLQTMVTWVDTNIVKPIIDGINSFIAVLQNIWPSVRQGFEDFKKGVEGILGPIFKMLNDIMNLVTGVETSVSAGGTLNAGGLSQMAGGPGAPPVVISTGGGSGGGGGFTPGYATGIRYVQSQGLAMLHPGERVLTANENAQYGDEQKSGITIQIGQIVANSYEEGRAAARGLKDEMAEEMTFNG